MRLAKHFGMVAVSLLLAGCASSSVSPDMTRHDQVVVVNGPLRLEAEDFPVQAGVFWALPFVTATSGAVVISSTQYGSLCHFALSGDANVSGRSIGVRVRFTERLTLCTAEVRALRYTATVSGLTSGSYDVAVIHDVGGKVDTLSRRTVTVQ